MCQLSACGMSVRTRNNNMYEKQQQRMQHISVMRIAGVKRIDWIMMVDEEFRIKRCLMKRFAKTRLKY